MDNVKILVTKRNLINALYEIDTFYPDTSH